ncbi:AbrB/MazE/SpoVT family DNA-binding domain-containing protein [Candidatus Micrarchaeota archaeon]|nr:AbrB/MazE/SpoVT family DNA-binding domain-containing protein [Candidatus Micrarchaeota archaeon]
MRTVILNDRGQIVIPEEVREGMGLKPGEALVLLEVGKEILLRKEASVVRDLVEIEGERRFWRALSEKSLERAWDREDEAWEKHAPARG